ncbi:hypothetical protein ANO11243_063980 [Dothideomycetidae sp. 11243]|nr:hypothetical protein ANO11243_063980 [fungal sp. No.11243]
MSGHLSESCILRLFLTSAEAAAIAAARTPQITPCTRSGQPSASRASALVHSGTALCSRTRTRIRVRVRIPRGSPCYDDDDSMFARSVEPPGGVVPCLSIMPSSASSSSSCSFFAALAVAEVKDHHGADPETDAFLPSTVTKIRMKFSAATSASMYLFGKCCL